MSRRALVLVAAAGAAAGIGFRIWALLLPQGPLDADEAIVGLLTHGILHGDLGGWVQLALCHFGRERPGAVPALS